MLACTEPSFVVTFTIPISSGFLQTLQYSPDGLTIIKTSDYSIIDTIAITRASGIDFSPNGGQIAVSDNIASPSTVSIITITDVVPVTIDPLVATCVPNASLNLTANTVGGATNLTYVWSLNILLYPVQLIKHILLLKMAYIALQ